MFGNVPAVLQMNLTPSPFLLFAWRCLLPFAFSNKLLSWILGYSLCAGKHNGPVHSSCEPGMVFLIKEAETEIEKAEPDSPRGQSTHNRVGETPILNVRWNWKHLLMKALWKYFWTA